MGMMAVGGMCLGWPVEALGIVSSATGKGDELRVMPSTAAGIARGDEPRLTPAEEARLTRSGYTLTPRLTVDERYDDNILMTEKRFSQNDFITDIAPSLLYATTGPNLDIAADLGVMWSQYSKHSNLSYFSTGGGAMVKADKWTDRVARGWGLTFTESYYYTKDYPTYASSLAINPLLSGGGIQVARVRTFVNEAGVKSTYTLTPQATLIGGYSHTFYNFNGPPPIGSTVRTPIDTQIHAATGGAEYASSRSLTWVGDYLYQHFIFGGGNTTADTHGVEAGFRKEFQNDWLFDAKAGATYLPFLTADRWTPTFNVGLTKKYLRTAAEVRYLRFVYNSVGLSPTPSVYNMAKIKVVHEFTPKLMGSVTYIHSDIKSIPGGTVDLTSYIVTPTLSYVFNKTWTAFASFSYYRSESSIPIELLEPTVGLTITRQTATVGVTLTWN